MAYNSNGGDCTVMGDGKLLHCDATDQQNGMCASENSDRPGHPLNLIRVLAVRLKSSLLSKPP